MTPKAEPVAPAIVALIQERAERAVKGLWGKAARSQNRAIIFEEMVAVARYAYKAGQDDERTLAKRPLIPTGEA